MLGDLDSHENREPKADSIALQDSSIGFDIALLLEPLHATQARRGRKPHPVGKLRVAQASVGLQGRDDLGVDGVEGGFWHGCVPQDWKSAKNSAGA